MSTTANNIGKKETRAGMTLVEIIVVMGIFVVLAASVRFFPIDYFYAQSLEDDGTKIAFTLRGARNRAVAQEAESKWGVHFVNSATSTDFYQVFKGDTYALGTVVERINMNETVQLVTPPSASSTDIIFSKLAGLPTGGSSIIISLVSNPSITKTVTILGTGQIEY
ncbi:MAG: hypothetical protein ACD_81C00184G0008 [uncultured bacterium]|uniref:General secretion pathway GspH domain-containing protein n=2 Tax=Candidatus Wolfeibacteriota TaxID=1752735 RepID=A0A0G1H596_9BACT|nr:MAG: hypothetical protein ACD_81C00184G0008 [uncultured bacterium]KKR12208.1 MAG: hypothetical protein UT41_C0003G0135 [Candidatus Wolfebacteria bacterium GW2011_GWC2_39_22]KKT42571.1 MAG: hypothetical protein UW32_C0005G0007 [Candidatus Wolfebacteria bacterium GW2011_GWE2_44_13]HBI25176.1 hypothetical protein [Candidatus Wolfebacteria bacterium]